jgi:hypothetical protein
LLRLARHMLVGPAEYFCSTTANGVKWRAIKGRILRNRASKTIF